MIRWNLPMGRVAPATRRVCEDSAGVKSIGSLTGRSERPVSHYNANPKPDRPNDILGVGHFKPFLILLAQMLARKRYLPLVYFQKDNSPTASLIHPTKTTAAHFDIRRLHTPWIPLKD